MLINYVLVNQIVPDAVGFVEHYEAPPPKPGNAGPVVEPPEGGVIIGEKTSLIQSFRSSTMQTLLIASGIALIAAGAVAALLGWLMAGHALKPVHTITATGRVYAEPNAGGGLRIIVYLPVTGPVPARSHRAAIEPPGAPATLEA